MSLLHALGRATSSLPALSSHGAAGAPGLSALRMTSTWAIARYLWAFDDADPAFKLSAITDQLRHHGKTLFSEQMGIATATYIVENLVIGQDKAPATIDIDAVFAHPALGPRVGALQAHRPDYLVHTPGSRTLIVLEVKGNSSGRTQAVHQLGRAVAQVLAMPDVADFGLRRLAIATTVSRHRITCYAIEVRVHGPREWREQALRATVRSSPDSRPVLWDSDEQFGIPQTQGLAEVPDQLDPDDVEDALSVGERARLLTYAGDPIDLGEASRTHHPATARATTFTSRSIEDIAYRGTTLRHTLGNTAFEVFAGVEAGLAEELVTTNRPRTTRRRTSGWLIQPVSEPEPIASMRGELRDLAVRASDGTVLQVSAT